MKRKYGLVSLFLSTIILFSSCGKTETDLTSSTDLQPSPNISSSEKNKTENTTEPENDKAKAEPSEIEKNNESAEKKKIIKSTIDTKTGYTDENRQVNVIGFKSYKKLKSKLYKDKAAKNKEFVVLFLEINNKQDDGDYINVNYLSTKVDGQEIKNSVLFNEPEGFQTIFQNIGANELLRGFIVWEVPEDWKKLEVVYDGWKDSNNLSIDCTFTPSDYFDPPQYS